MSYEIEIDDLDTIDKVKIKLSNGKEREFSIIDELDINSVDLDDAFEEQPGKYAWWASLAETAKYQRDRAESELDVAEAQADYDIRLELELDGLKVTETAVKHRVKLNKDYQKALQKYQEAKKTALAFDKIVRAFDQRLDALISLGANLRSEGNNAEVTMLKKKAKTITNKK